jgi:hypothetical protein
LHHWRKRQPAERGWCAGACWNNRNFSDVQPPNALYYWNDSEGNRDTVKTDVLSGYAFVFALENALDVDYFTEKRYEALAAGAVRSCKAYHASA